ncbi:MAG: hypothetical protein Q8O56_07500 [Solirubrobacteraceae bacterium]|nr:hypothetical protein [Solirubrobacteraceae bacterium]
MQSPIMVFDHVKQTVTVVAQGSVSDKKVVEALAAQRGQVTSSGGSPAR